MAEPIPNPEPSFQAPIPGASLTTELGKKLV